MPTWTFDGLWYEYALWNALAFVVAFFLNSFIEYGAHRWVLHSNRFVSFAYDLHANTHHVLFQADETYHAQNDEMLQHIRFVPRDYVLFLLITTPIWIGAELLTQRPLVIGGVLATLAGLQLFNSLHLYFHAPKGRWIERTRIFRYLKEHHRLHHSDTTKNLNVVMLPVADLFFGTLAKQSDKETKHAETKT